MEYLGIGIIIILILMMVAKGIDKNFGTIGCLVVFLIVFVWMCSGIEKEVEENKAAQERMDKAVEKIRKDKEDYNRQHNIPNKQYNE